MKYAIVLMTVVLAGSAWGQTYPTSVSVSILGCPFHEVIKPILDGAGKKIGEACVVPAPMECG